MDSRRSRWLLRSQLPRFAFGPTGAQARLTGLARSTVLGGATVSTGVGSALGCRWSASLLKMAKTQLPTTQISHSLLSCGDGSLERGPEHPGVPVTNRGLPDRMPVSGQGN